MCPLKCNRDGQIYFFSGPATAIFSLFGDSGQSEDLTSPLKLVLAPANATVSPGVGVTLGCVASVPIEACQWSFYSSTEPDKRHELAPFSPASKYQKRKGRTDVKVSLN